MGAGPLSLETPSKIKNKRKRSSGKPEIGNQSPSKKRKFSDGSGTTSPDSKKQNKASEKKNRKSPGKGKGYSRKIYKYTFLWKKTL